MAITETGIIMVDTIMVIFTMDMAIPSMWRNPG